MVKRVKGAAARDQGIYYRDLTSRLFPASFPASLHSKQQAIFTVTYNHPKVSLIATSVVVQLSISLKRISLFSPPSLTQHQQYVLATDHMSTAATQNPSISFHNSHPGCLSSATVAFVSSRHTRDRGREPPPC